MVANPWHNVKKVVVVGLGVTGLSVVNYLLRKENNFEIRVIDTRENVPGCELLSSSVPLHNGSFNLDWLLNADLVVTNPGIALATPEIQKVLASGIPVVGDIELFAWENDKPVIAITGSNGKSTVTDWTGQALSAVGLDVAVGGNIGVPALDLLQHQADIYVLELSSFQLETTSSLRSKVAVFLNLSEDHMDRYQSMDDYRNAKLRIFDNADVRIVNADDIATYPLKDSSYLEFSLDKKTDFAVTTQDDVEFFTLQGKKVMSTSEISLVGRHNVSNCLVVLALLHSAGVDIERALPVIKSYSGLTHRCQVVLDNGGIKWVNDSKATNLASTKAALTGLRMEGKLFLLVGGVSKGADFSELAPILKNLNVQLCCFGQDGDAFMSLHPSAKRFESMNEIVHWISGQMKRGDVVMLSPACASFDQFKNFMARGDEFTELARSLVS